jgi:hypothetical protein
VDLKNRTKLTPQDYNGGGFYEESALRFFQEEANLYPPGWSTVSFIIFGTLNESLHLFESTWLLRIDRCLSVIFG